MRIRPRLPFVRPRKAAPAVPAPMIVRVRGAAGSRQRGWLLLDGRAMPVALGRGGIRANKREGDGGTHWALARQTEYHLVKPKAVTP